MAKTIAQNTYTPKYFVDKHSVIEELKKYILVDGFDLVLDLEKSKNPYFYDARTNKRYTDFFTCFASLPLGLNHPQMLEEGFMRYLAKAALNKPSNSDIYTEEMATFIKTFHKIAVPEAFKYSFYVSGGALAVENALKTAFDWKVRKNFQKGYKEERGQQIIHFKQAFHGRSGYTMSLTNTDPAKIMYYPKFQWPRIINPTMEFPQNTENIEKVIKLENQAVEEIKSAFLNNKDDIAAIIIEPIQGEGGDNHFRPEFLKMLKQLCIENEALLIFDEVQTGVGITGTMWAHEQLEVTPDIMVFGKKMQICGIIATNRVDEVPDNVFHTSSRINSTWGGNLADMIRAMRYLEIIEQDKLIDNVNVLGEKLNVLMLNLAEEFHGFITNIRGRGLFRAFDLPNSEIRNKLRYECFNEGLLILACGDRSLRFRPPLNLTEDQMNEGFKIMADSIRNSLNIR